MADGRGIHISSGVGFVGLLQLIFITLKLTGHIEWSWLWVLAPIWAIPALVVFVILVVIGIGLLVAYSDHRRGISRLKRVRWLIEKVSCPACNSIVCRTSLKECASRRCRRKGCIKCLTLQVGLCPECYDIWNRKFTRTSKP